MKCVVLYRENHWSHLLVAYGPFENVAFQRVDFFSEHVMYKRFTGRDWVDYYYVQVHVMGNQLHKNKSMEVLSVITDTCPDIKCELNRNIQGVGE